MLLTVAAPLTMVLPSGAVAEPAGAPFSNPVVPHGGTAPIATRLTGLPNGCSSNDSSRMVGPGRSAGRCTVNVSAADEAGTTASGTVTGVVAARTTSAPASLSDLGAESWLLVVAAATGAGIAFARSRRRSRPT